MKPVIIVLLICCAACVAPSVQVQSTAAHAAQSTLERIAAANPQLQAVIAVAPNVMDQVRLNKGSDGALLQDWSILLKDNIESRELPTTAGSLALANNHTERDAPLVAGLRQAGAIIVGKANLSQWANFRSTRSSSGWSAVGGQTRNPHDLNRSPCGSSSGSAAAVAAGLVRAAIGTETNGSIVCPAAATGIVGIKPTVGLVSRRHVVPISHSQDTAGPMARSVADAVSVLQALAKPDRLDSASSALPATTWQRDYRSSLKPGGLRGKRLGVIAGGYHSDVDTVYAQAQRDLEQAGAVLVPVEFELPDDFWAAQFDVLMYEFKHGLNQYLATLPDATLQALTLAKLIQFNVQHSSQELRWFGQEIFEQSEQKGGLDQSDYLDKLRLIQEATRQNGIDRLLLEHRLDALIAPTGAPAWSIDLVNGDHFLGGSSSYAAVSGYPNITVPMGFVQNLPVGLSIFGAHLAEPKLIEIAYAYEHATQHWRKPVVWFGD